MDVKSRREDRETGVGYPCFEIRLSRWSRGGSDERGEADESPTYASDQIRNAIRVACFGSIPEYELLNEDG